MGLLDGKRGAILNIANDRSIAWHIANNAVKQGAQCAFGFLPLDKMERRVRKAMEEGGFGQMPICPCDVSKDEDIAAFVEFVKQTYGTVDFLVHSLAFANKEFLQIGRFTETPREVFKQALDISAYSLIALSRAFAPIMPNGGSIICLSYLGAAKVVPGYNVMGVAKSALESTARYLAYELGEKRIRVNSLSAGPVRTLSAMAVGGIDAVFDHVEMKSPLRRNIDGDEVGKVAAYLLSDLSSGVTGETVYVDCGYNIVGL